MTRRVRSKPNWEAPVQEFIARENIRRFEQQLETCSDPEQRKTLCRLLETERERLAEALVNKQARRKAT